MVAFISDGVVKTVFTEGFADQYTQPVRHLLRMASLPPECPMTAWLTTVCRAEVHV